MQNIKTRFITSIIFFFLIYTVMLYVIARAVCLVITHDEAYSFYNVKHFWYVETLCTGNTHWFNFLAMKTAILFGLEKASQLRWFAVFSSAVYLTVAYFWIRSLKDLPTKIFAFTVALLNPFLIDYLGLARGYATGLMFESLAIVCVCMAIKKRGLAAGKAGRKITILSLFFAGMASIANFNFFYFFVAFGALYFYRFYLKQGFDFIRQKWFYLELIYCFGISFLVLRALKFMTECSNDIGEYGGDSLVTSIFAGFIDTFLYGKYKLSLSAVEVCGYVLFLLLMIMATHSIVMFRKHKNTWYTIASSLLVIMLGLCVFNKWCFDVLYPTYRTTLMFYPLIALVIVGFFSTIITYKKTKAALFYGISISLFAHFVTTINTGRTFDYYQQEDSKNCFEYLKSIGAKKVGLCGELFGVYRNYYQMTEKYKYPFEAERLNTDALLRDTRYSDDIMKDEYLVLFPPYNMSFYKGTPIQLKGMKYYQSSGTLVVRISH
ncbi:MAG: hypothetical protein V4677_03380 [Bacteroidota bacterium]